MTWDTSLYHFTASCWLWATLQQQIRVHFLHSTIMAPVLESIPFCPFRRSQLLCIPSLTPDAFCLAFPPITYFIPALPARHLLRAWAPAARPPPRVLPPSSRRRPPACPRGAAWPGRSSPPPQAPARGPPLPLPSANGVAAPEPAPARPRAWPIGLWRPRLRPRLVKLGQWGCCTRQAC